MDVVNRKCQSTFLPSNYYVILAYYHLHTLFVTYTLTQTTIGLYHAQFFQSKTRGKKGGNQFGVLPSQYSHFKFIPKVDLLDGFVFVLWASVVVLFH